MEADDPIAPFVLKTYHMVCDPSTDAVISWSHGNNSFVVLDPLNFSQRLLPTYFKHSNFSSFVRQLNTYGFRKVDPDRWEFANESFLRGQKQLLKKIIRRRSQQRNSTLIFPNHEEEMEKSMLSTLSQLKNDQRELEEELEGINRRLQATEKKPQKMIAFLVKVAEDPDLLSKMVVEKEAARRLKKKKRRLMISSSSPSPSTTTSSSSFSSASTASTTIETEMKNEEVQDIDVLLPNETSQRHLGTRLVGDEDLFAIVTAATASASTDFVTTNTTTSTNAAADALTSSSFTITVPPPFESNAQHNNNSNRMTFFSEWIRGMGSNIQ